MANDVNPDQTVANIQSSLCMHLLDEALGPWLPTESPAKTDQTLLVHNLGPVL